MAQIKRVPKKPNLFESKQEPNPVVMRQQIETLAYSIYEERGRTPGRELDDWLEAERRVLNEQ